MLEKCGFKGWIRKVEFDVSLIIPLIVKKAYIIDSNIYRVKNFAKHQNIKVNEKVKLKIHSIFLNHLLNYKSNQQIICIIL